ncbi:MAG: hypothetical protein IPM39_04810 [Chloroflexi bacterium]|nr:hypothetical protein [Chloroflexota bacterium]
MKHYTLTETLENEKGQLHLLVEIGEVTIRPHDGRDIIIEADLRHMTIAVTRQEDVVSLRVEQEEGEWLQKIGRLFSADGHPKAVVTIHVPPTCAIYAKTITGKMVISDIAAPVTATVVTGKNELANIGGRIDARATTGEISYKGRLADDHHRFEAVTGSIRLSLTGEPNAQFDGRVVTGDAHCDFPLAQPKTTNGFTGKHLKVTLVDGAGTLKARVITGSIRVQQAESKEAVGLKP